MKLLAAIIAAAISLAWTLSAQAQNPLLNPNFDSGTHGTVGVVTDWNVNGNVASHTEGATSDIYSAVLSAGADSEGDTLSQTFATTAGLQYQLDFDAGIYGQRTDSPLQLRIQVFGTGTLLDETVTPPDTFTYQTTEVSFKHYTFTFTADSAQTTLQFSNIGLGNANADVVVDTVSVVPEPSSVMTLIFGAALLLGVVLFRRQRALAHVV
jgi:hypothetical protein